MEKEVQYGDLCFRRYLDADTIAHAVHEVAEQLNRDYQGKTPLFLLVLNGAFMFASDLMKQISFECTMSCVKLSSYQGGLQSTGKVRELMGLNEDIHGKDIIIVEDIVDTGTTMHHLIPQLKEKGATSVEVCTFLLKPAALKHEDARPKYAAVEIPNKFIIGYGLDIEEQARNLPEVYELKKD